jgi:putative ABC transport system permease protein
MNMDLSIFARLRSGISERQAQQAVDREVRNITASEGGVDLRNLGYGIDLRRLSWHIAGDLRRPLLLLWFAALVLLIAACANVAGLLLARADAAGVRRLQFGFQLARAEFRF